jgi:ribosomal protein S18 acetylase RimI-like enzyme
LDRTESAFTGQSFFQNPTEKRRGASAPPLPEVLRFDRPLLLSRGSSSDNDRVAADPPVVIRHWEPRDRDTVQRLLRLFSVDAEVSCNDAPTYVAVQDRHVVGMVTLCVFQTLTGSKAYLDHLVVEPRMRRRGIGRALVEHAITRARAAGAARIDLTAGDQKYAGRALYLSIGFCERDTSVFRLLLWGSSISADTSSARCRNAREA